MADLGVFVKFEHASGPVHIQSGPSTREVMDFLRKIINHEV